MARLLSLQRQIGTDKYQAYVGNTYRVLVEGEGEENGFLTGRTSGYMIVEFPGKIERAGEFVNVRITKAHDWALIGEIIE